MAKRKNQNQVAGPPTLSTAVARLFADQVSSAPFTTRLYLLLRAFLNYFQTLLPTGTFHGFMRRRLGDWLINKFNQVWPSIDPITNSVKRLYYEFQIVNGSNEFEWIQHWLNNRPKMTKEHRRVRVSTGNKKVLASGGLPDESPEIRALRKDLGYKGLPYSGETHWFTYKGGLFQAHIRKLLRQGPPGPNGQPPVMIDDGEPDDLYVKLFATNRAPFLFLLAEAKKNYEANNPPVIEITHFQGHCWGPRTMRQKRSFDDVILTPENRQKLEHLVDDFLRSGNWYLNRGLSWKRGILLHGPPGCGKTSTIVGLASKYDLKVYHLSLNHAGLDDESLADSMRHVGQRSIVCLEDCDVWAKAHNRRLAEKEARINGQMTPFGPMGTTADQEGLSQSAPPPPPPPPSAYMSYPPGRYPPPPPPPPPPGMYPPTFIPPPPPRVPESRLSLAGLLNVLDGVEEQKGILYILTSNDPSALDAAMTRPGRVDATIELGRATRQQAEDLFNIFYKPYDEETPDYDLAQVPVWAKSFAKQINHYEFSVASLQNFLLEHRTDPASAVAAMPEWVRQKRFPQLFTTAPVAAETAPESSTPSPERTDEAAERDHPQASTNNAKVAEQKMENIFADHMINIVPPAATEKTDSASDSDETATDDQATSRDENKPDGKDDV